MIMCVGPPVAFVPITNMGPPYLNYSMSVAGNGLCSTYYTRTVTTVCATTLTGLATRIKVSQCSREVTFSSNFGYDLETPSLVMNSSALITPAPAIKWPSHAIWLRGRLLPAAEHHLTSIARFILYSQMAGWTTHIIIKFGISRLLRSRESRRSYSHGVQAGHTHSRDHSYGYHDDNTLRSFRSAICI